MKTLDLAKRLRPLVDAFARELTAIVQARLDAVVAEAELAIEGALSAIVADLEAQAAPMFGITRTVDNSGPRWDDEPVPEPAVDAMRALAAKARPELKARAKVVSKDVRRACGCARRGRHRNDCTGAAHETVLDEEDDEPEVRVAELLPMSKRDRFAQIEAAAAARRNLVLPTPRSSFELKHEPETGNLAQVRELDAEELEG